VNDKAELGPTKIYGICAHDVKGGSTIIFNDVLSSVGINKRFVNEKLKDSENDKTETDYISFQSLSKSPSTWFKFLRKFLKTSYTIFTNTRGYSVALANELISILYIFPHKAFKRLDIIYYCHSAFRITVFNKLFLSRFINYYSDVIVVPSFYLKDELIKIGISSSKIQVIYNGTHEISLPKKSQNNNLDKKLNVCIVGVIQYQKGQDVFIEAIKNLNRDGYYVTGNIVGPIRENVYYEDLKNKLVIEESLQNIYFLGSLDHQTAIKFMNAQDVIICLSRYRETLPTVLLEAMSLGKAIIGTNIGGIPEIITDGENGYLIDPDNVNQLQAAILKLMDQEHRLQLGESGYKLFLNKFNRETFLSQHKLLIQKCFQKQIEN